MPCSESRTARHFDYRTPCAHFIHDHQVHENSGPSQSPGMPAVSTPPPGGDGYASLHAQCERNRSLKSWRRKIRASYHIKQISKPNISTKRLCHRVCLNFFFQWEMLFYSICIGFSMHPRPVFKSFKTFSVLNLIHSFIHTSSWEKSFSYMLFLLFLFFFLTHRFCIWPSSAFALSQQWVSKQWVGLQRQAGRWLVSLTEPSRWHSVCQMNTSASSFLFRWARHQALICSKKKKKNIPLISLSRFWEAFSWF